MIFTEYANDFWHKRKMYNFNPYNVLLAIATYTPATFGRSDYFLLSNECVLKCSEVQYFPQKYLSKVKLQIKKIT